MTVLVILALVVLWTIAIAIRFGDDSKIRFDVTQALADERIRATEPVVRSSEDDIQAA